MLLSILGIVFIVLTPVAQAQLATWEADTETNPPGYTGGAGNLWEGSAGAHDSYTPVNAPVVQAISAAGAAQTGYTQTIDFNGTNQRFNISAWQGDYGNIQTLDASHRFFISPDTLMGDRYLWESGGTGDGTGIVLRGTTLIYGVNSNNSAPQVDSTVSVDLSPIFDGTSIANGDYLQIDAIVHPSAIDGYLGLVVTNLATGTSVANSTNWQDTSWDGGDGGALGFFSGGQGGNRGDQFGTNAFVPFDGQIAAQETYADGEIRKYWVGGSAGGGIGWQENDNWSANQAGDRLFDFGDDTFVPNQHDVLVLHADNAPDGNQVIQLNNPTRNAREIRVLEGATFGSNDLFIVRSGGTNNATLNLFGPTAIDVRSDGSQTDRTLRFDSENSLGGNERNLAIEFESGGTSTINIAGATDAVVITPLIRDGQNAATTIEKTGAGTLRIGNGAFTDNRANTFSATLSVADGAVELAKGANTDAIGGDLTIGDGVGAANSAEVTLINGGQIPDSSDVFIDTDGIFNLNGNNETINGLAGNGRVSGDGELTIGGNGGTLAPGASVGTLTVDADLTLDSSGGFDVDFEGAAGAGVDPGGHDQVVVTGAGRTVTLGGDLTFTTEPSAPVTGSFTLIDLVDSSSTLTGTFSGLGQGSAVEAGGQIFSVNYAGGTNSNDFTLETANVVYWRGGDDPGGNIGWQNNANWFADRSGTDGSATQAIAGDVLAIRTTNAGTDVIQINQGGMTGGRTIGSIVVLPDEDLPHNGSGNFEIREGGSTLNETLTLTHQAAIQFLSDGSVTNRTLDFNADGSNSSRGDYNLAFANGSQGSIIDVQGSTDEVRISFDINDAASNNSTSLTKKGDGTLTLAGDNGYTQQIIVEGGTLALSSSTSNNNIASSSEITVRSGGTLDVSGITALGGFQLADGQTLSGTGTVAGNLTIADGSTIAPGNSIGSLAQGNTVWNGGSFFDFEFNGLGDGGSGSGTAGTNWDELNITGTLDLMNLSQANPITVNLLSRNSTDTGGPANIAGWNSTTDYRWTFVTTTLGITGFNKEHFAIDTSGFIDTIDMTNPYGFVVKQEGNNLVLFYTAVPEPGTVGVLVALLSGLALRRRRRSLASESAVSR